MGFYVGNGHKKRLFSLILFQKIQCKICDTVCPVSVKLTLLHIFIKDIPAIPVGGKFQEVCCPPVSTIAAPSLGRNRLCLIVHNWRCAVILPLACQMPFAHIGSLISRLIQIICQCFHMQGKRLRIAKTVDCCGILSCLKKRPAWPAHRLGCIGLLKKNALLCQRIQVRADIQLLTIASQRVVSLLVCKIKYNIWFSHPFLLLLQS